MYMLAWKKGLKTTYYLRSRGATQTEKSTLDVNRFGIQPRWMKSSSASSAVVIDRATAPSFTAGTNWTRSHGDPAASHGPRSPGAPANPLVPQPSAPIAANDAQPTRLVAHARRR